MFSDDRWTTLTELFLSELFRLHSLPPASLLEVHLQAGLSALKSPQSDKGSACHAVEGRSDTMLVRSGNGNGVHHHSTAGLTMERKGQQNESATMTSNGINKGDPLSLPDFQRLAHGLPSAKHVHSKLVCAITGSIMTEHDPPMVLPNGYAYSQKAMMAMAEKSGGKVRCPCTGKEYEYRELRRAFVM